ncbi:MAG: putative glycosyltransferase, partial [Verrucomicrobiaceae bacterium]|nr:putative glycosyltransferase [Verrucomicrobiaceae bacterium]
EEHGQQEAVIFTGFIPENELPDYYRLCDAFVMPSTGEGFGIVYLEALASGRPCIVGNTDASPEAIGNGRLGLVVDPHSVAAITAAVIQLLTRHHSKPWLHEPETLQHDVAKLYGWQAFKRSLNKALAALLPAISNNENASGS